MAGKLVFIGDRPEIVDYMAQPIEAQEFADRVESECSISRRRLGYKGYFNTTGDAILTAYLAGYRAALAPKPQRRIGGK